MEFARVAGNHTLDTHVFNVLDSVGWNVKPISPITESLPFVSSPSSLLACLGLYFVVVIFSLFTVTPADPTKKVARKPFFGEYFIVLAHNVFLCGLSAYMCGRIVYEAYSNNYALWGNAYNPAEIEMGKVIYIFYVSKVYEFIDTFIMIAKKNMRQVSFLHVYHHGTISFVWWMISYSSPGGDAYWSAAANSFVHVWMYLYYLIAHVLPADPATRKKYLWWGKYLTQLQLTQFAVNMAQAVYLMSAKESKYPRFLSELLFWYMLSLIALFGHFYVKKHMSGKKESKEAKRTK